MSQNDDNLSFLFVSVLIEIKLKTTPVLVNCEKHLCGSLNIEKSLLYIPP